MAFDVRISKRGPDGVLRLSKTVTFDQYMEGNSDLVDLRKSLKSMALDEEETSLKEPGKSIYKYLRCRRHREKGFIWQSKPQRGGRTEYLGTFDTELEAIDATANFLGCSIESLEKKPPAKRDPKLPSPYKYVTHVPLENLLNPWRAQKMVKKRFVYFGHFSTALKAASVVSARLGIPVKDLRKAS